MDRTLDFLQDQETSELTGNENGRLAAVWRSGTLAVGVSPLLGSEEQFEMIIVLDDKDSVVDGNANSWRQWLHLANLAGVRTDPTVITTTSQMMRTSESVPMLTDAERAAANADSSKQEIPESWQQPVSSAIDEEKELLLALILKLGEEAPAPEVGVETDSGIPLSIAWPQWHIAVSFGDLSEDEASELTSLGWRLVDPDPDTLAEELTTRLGAR